jgi:hypothetical protein
MSVFLLLSICGLIHVLFSVSCFNLCGSAGLFPFLNLFLSPADAVLGYGAGPTSKAF